MEKTCTKCGATKDVDEFFRDRTRRDGRHPWCKACKYKSIQSWVDRNPVKVNRAKRRYCKKHPDRRLKSVNEWNARNEEKVAAHAAVKNAISSGRLVKEPCECGSLDVEAHHDNYDKPLDVKWRCPKCHKPKHHRRMPCEKA